GVPAVGGDGLRVLFELGDHLGSASTVIDRATGELVEKASYLGYGGAESDHRPARWGSFREDHRFTGKEEDVEVGLVYFGKRFLNAQLGRWVSADPLIVHAAGADLNAYAYVSGRLLAAVDPLGLNEACRCSDASDSPEAKAVAQALAAGDFARLPALRDEQAGASGASSLLHHPGGARFVDPSPNEPLVDSGGSTRAATDSGAAKGTRNAAIDQVAAASTGVAVGAPIFAPHVYLVARALSLLRADDPTTSQPVTLQQAAESQAYQRNYQGVGLLVGLPVSGRESLIVFGPRGKTIAAKQSAEGIARCVEMGVMLPLA
ncbi:MAG: RHS repeat-associated core domain-containing protein, partial [Polyangiaceae bacterium]|nr:RHS repeat-associated core domain-containing protein [Polyangiaceae bacterium]